MSTFIEVCDMTSSQVLLNVSEIVAIKDNNGKAVFAMTSGVNVVTPISFDRVVAVIKDDGANFFSFGGVIK